MLIDELRALTLLEGLTDDQLQSLVDAGELVRYEPGETLWTAGTPADRWMINLEGRIDMVRVSAGEESVVGALDVPGRWAGGFGAWDENAVYLATGRATTSGRLLRVPSLALRALLADLPLISHLVEGVFRTARNIEAGARQRDALVTLGTLSAGLAHELNNPAAATARAVDALEAAMGQALSSLDRLAAGDITAAQFTAIGELRDEIPARPPHVDGLALADREDELADWFDAHGIERGWALASALAPYDVDLAWCDRVAAAIDGPALGAAFTWIASTRSAATLLGEVKESTRRVSELVSAVKSYSQMDRAALQHIDVTEGLESTLVMLGHKLRQGITVERDYGGDVPQIDAYAGELNQVWTNLVDNAVDAMDGTGTLRVVTRPEDDGVVVCIGDSGSGMPPEVVARAFEAFFTTKPVGKGTGLGLDIARRIVSRHGGSITVVSEPGDTLICVHLPARPPAR